MFEIVSVRRERKKSEKRAKIKISKRNPSGNGKDEMSKHNLQAITSFDCEEGSGMANTY